MFKDLVQAAQEGDGQAMEVIIERLLPLIISSIKRYYYKPNEFPDLIQEGNLTIIEAVEDFDMDRNIPFLAFIQSRLKYLYLNMHKIKTCLSLNNPLGEEGEEFMDLLVAEDKSPLEVLLDREIDHELREALDRLTGRQREIIKLYYFQRLSMAEIGSRLNISYRTVVNIKVQALKKLKSFLPSS